MTIDGLPVYRWNINDDEEIEGVSVMSIVDDPAVERSFQKYSRQRKVKYSLNHEKRIITGVALRAGFPIYRNDEQGEYYTIFDAPTIERLVHKFMRELRNGKVSINHEYRSNGAYLFESFILRQEHKKVFPEFEDIEVGSWIVSYKVEDDDVWDSIKRGELNGFSVEIFGQLVEYKKHKTKELIELYNTVNAVISGHNSRNNVLRRRAKV